MEKHARGDGEMDLTALMNQNVGLAAVALLFIGGLLKRIKRFPNWCVPYVLGVLGILFCNLMMGWSASSTVQGFAAAGAAVYLHQMGKHGVERIKSSRGGPCDK